MATFISDNQKFHIFSKSPVRANMELFQATNKSGHTVISDEVRTDDIPWFINVPDVNNPPSYVKDPRKNDIIFQGKFNSLSTAAVCKKWDGEKWVDGPNLKENPILKNENDDDVIQVHFESDIDYVSDTNNAGTTSDKQAAFVLKTNGEMLTHFVSPTDKIYNGIPSNGYGLYLFLDSQLQSETDSNNNGYIANSYAGIIQFNKARSEAASKFKVITFEYIGGYLSKSLNKIEDDLKDYIDEEIEEHNKEFEAHKKNENSSEQHLSQSEVNSLNSLASTSKISAIDTATQYDYQSETDLTKALSAETTPNTSDSTFKNVTIKLHLRDKVLQQSTMPVTSKAIYNHVHKQSVNIEKASDNVTVEEVTTNENERRKYTIAVDGYTTSETDNIVDDIYEKIQATADDINKNVVEHTSNNGIHITDTERTSWNNNEVVLQKHLNDQNSHVSEAERSSWDTAATKAGTAVQTVKRADDSSTLISVNQSGTTVSVGLSDTVATKTDISNSIFEVTKNLQQVESDFAKHTSNGDEGYLHVTEEDKINWNSYNPVVLNIPNINPDDSEYFIIYNSSSPTYISFANEIVDGTKLFWNRSLKTFDIDLPNLENGTQMFEHCWRLSSFNADISNLKNGTKMFRSTYRGNLSGINGKLSIFNSSLKSLTNGTQMFEGQQLNKDSVLSILNSIKTENEHTEPSNLYLGIDSSLESDIDILNELGVDTTTITTLNKGGTYKITNKNGNVWTIIINWN